MEKSPDDKNAENKANVLNKLNSLKTRHPKLPKFPVSICICWFQSVVLALSIICMVTCGSLLPINTAFEGPDY